MRATGGQAVPAFDLRGVTAGGDPVEVEVVGTPGRTLLAFLAVDCTGCEVFWEAFGAAGGHQLGGDVRVVVVTKGPARVAPRDVVAAAGALGDMVVMSDQAWADYRVSSYPFLVLVDGTSDRVVGEAVGMGWDDVVALLQLPSLPA